MTTGKPIKIKIGGRIDENSGFPQIPGTPQSIALDLNGVTMINSTGIKRWVEWVKGLPSVPVYMDNVPPIVIDQCNMVYDFVPRDAVFRSFLVPFYDDDSDETKHVLYRLGTEFVEENGSFVLKHPEVKNSAGEDMELDVIPSKFFQFLSKK